MTLYERVQTDVRTDVTALTASGTPTADVLAYVRVTFAEVLRDLTAQLTPKTSPVARIAQATKREATPTPDIAWKPIKGMRGYEVSSQGAVRSYWRRGRSSLAKEPIQLKTHQGKYAMLKGGVFKVKDLMATAFA